MSRVCDLCGEKRARVRRTTRSYGRGKGSFLIERVPVVTCYACRESYLTAETLREIDRIRQHWRKLTVMKRVPVVDFGAA